MRVHRPPPRPLFLAALCALPCLASCAGGGVTPEPITKVQAPSPSTAAAGLPQAGSTSSPSASAGTGGTQAAQSGQIDAGPGAGAAGGTAGKGGTAGNGGMAGNGAAGAKPVEPLDAGVARDAGSPPGNTGGFAPAPGTSWQWQLSGQLDTSFDVKVYDIDLYETSANEITALHADGRKVVCYFDTAYEPSRPDSKQLEPYRGNPIDGWPGQYWVDFREAAVVDVMKARIGIAHDKACDGIEADDVDARSNDPGFSISAEEQRAFIRTLADAAHAAGIAFGLKNDLEDVGALLAVSDFAVNEECFQYDECDALAPFIKAGKAVFQVEYTDGDLAQKGARICPDANAQNFDTLIKHLDLDAPRFSCR